MTQKLDMFISLLGDFTVAANETWKGQSFYLCQGRSTPYIGDRFIQPLIGNPYVYKSLQAQAWSPSLPQENNGSLQYTPRKLQNDLVRKTCILQPPLSTNPIGITTLLSSLAVSGCVLLQTSSPEIADSKNTSICLGLWGSCPGDRYTW